MHNRKGFTLLDLMIVVVIIFILAILAIPRFILSSKESQKNGTLAILKDLYAKEMNYYESNHKFWGNGLIADSTHPDTFTEIGIRLPEHCKYSFRIVFDETGMIGQFENNSADPTKGNFSIRAEGNLDGDATMDIWILNQAGMLLCVSDDIYN